MPNKRQITILCDLKPMRVFLREHKRAKRYILKCDPVRQQIIVTLPKNGSNTIAKKLIQKHSGWLKKQLESGLNPVPFLPNTILPYQGHSLLLHHANVSRGITCLDRESQPNRLIVFGDIRHFSRRVHEFFKKQALRLFCQRVQYYSRKLNVKPGTVRIRDTKTRWGSCSIRGTLSFSWRLIFAPPEVLDYLAAHEVAHLKEMNHGKQFWEHVAFLYPDYIRSKEWLKANGRLLHCYGQSKTS